jgi:hypothetical protein
MKIERERQRRREFVNRSIAAVHAKVRARVFARTRARARVCVCVCVPRVLLLGRVAAFMRATPAPFSCSPPRGLHL